MNPEKSFDPHNPEYKKVEDLPQEEQANFVDVEGGFVGKEAVEMFEQSKKNRSFFDKVLGKNETSELHEKALYDEDIKKRVEARRIKEKREAKIIESLKDGEIGRTFDGLESRDEKIDFVDGLKEFVREKLGTEMKSNIQYETILELRKGGHEGLLFIERCNDECELLSGFLDGKLVNVHTANGGKIGDRELSSTEGRVLVNSYRNAAINLGEGYFNGVTAEKKFDYIVDSAIGNFLGDETKIGTTFNVFFKEVTGRIEEETFIGQGIARDTLARLRKERSTLWLERHYQKQEDYVQRSKEEKRREEDQAERGLRDLLPRQ